ncbi:phospholipase A2, minor isoenzyme-like [Sparus aurata]|uniref:phospholipase A2, minor isoenzyme-like n=1 Tax=Sparus aurata TaxID=8175 RepID=UPI0011C15715|nr:phospholipase A2, minor isoenzyme-like [Sparus aurata]
MNLSGPLLMLLLTACTVSGRAQLTDLWQFEKMIRCVQPGVDISKYADYGCYCGDGGTPVDEVDQCCKVFDECYGAQMSDPECQSFSEFPFFSRYDFTCSRGRPTCSASNNNCQAAACECDRAAALCFTRAKYNPEHKYMDPKLCKK